MASLSPDHESRRLLSGWCDGTLSDAEIHPARCVAACSHPGFRDFYLKYMDQHAVLAAAVLPIGDVRLMVQCPGAFGDEMSGRVDAVRAGSGTGFRDLRAWRFPRMRRAWRRWIVVAAVFVVAGMIARQWPAGPPQPAIASSPPAAGDPPRLGLAAPDSPSWSRLERAVWESGPGQRPSEGDLLASGRLILHSGRMTLGMLSGVTLTLEGPADLELLSIDQVHCRRGKLRTSVPRGRPRASSSPRRARLSSILEPSSG